MQGEANSIYFKTGAIIICLLLSHAVFAHTINYALEKAPVGNVIWYYLKLGFKHIVPQGLDHILFVAGLCLLCGVAYVGTRRSWQHGSRRRNIHGITNSGERKVALWVRQHCSK